MAQIFYTSLQKPGLTDWPAAAGGTIISLAYVATGGATLASNGILLTPGLLTVAQINAGRGVLYNNGVEVAVFIKPLFGKHPDGSCKSLLLQVAVSSVSSGTLTFDTGATRTLSALSETVITGSNFTSHSRVLPSTSSFLCNTRVTGEPLRPEASYNSVCNPLYVTHFNDRYSVISAGYSPAQTDLSTYEYIRAIIAKWCVTGNSTYFVEAVRRAAVRVQLPTPTSSGDTYALINPEPITGYAGDVNGRPGEQHTQCMVGLMAMYHLTGWEQFRLVVAHWGQWRMAGTDTLVKAKSTTINGTGWIQNGNNPRANIKQLWAACCQVLVEKNIAVSGAYGTGRTITFATELDWMIDAINTNVWAIGGYRSGLPGIVGSPDNSASQSSTGQFPDAATDIPLFQLGLIADALAFIRYNIIDDSRIKPLQKKIADVVIAHMAPLVSGDVAFGVAEYGYYYWLGATANTSALDIRQPWTMPMHASNLGWVYCDTGDTQYKTAMERCMNAGNVATSHLTQGADGTGAKIFGELFGNQMGSPFLYEGVLPTGLPTSIYEP